MTEDRRQHVAGTSTADRRKSVTDRDRRRHPRRLGGGGARVRLERPGVPPVAAVVHDLSRSGIGLTAGQALRPGVEFGVLLGGDRVRVRCRVMSCHPSPDGREYQIGAEFLTIARATEATEVTETTGVTEVQG